MCVCVRLHGGHIESTGHTKWRNRIKVGHWDNRHLCKQCPAHLIIGHILLIDLKDVDYTNHPNVALIPVHGPDCMDLDGWLAVSYGYGNTKSEWAIGSSHHPTWDRSVAGTCDMCRIANNITACDLY